MESIKAHIFDTIEQAETAISTINKGEGIPISPTATTRTYCIYEENEGTIFIRADEVTEKYLGEPVDLELINYF
jgi:archaellum component FlaG (FlaF/FlaG flagellin family)